MSTNILAKIVEDKFVEVAARKKQISIAQNAWKRQQWDLQPAPICQ